MQYAPFRYLTLQRSYLILRYPRYFTLVSRVNLTTLPRTLVRVHSRHLVEPRPRWRLDISPRGLCFYPLRRANHGPSLLIPNPRYDTSSNNLRSSWSFIQTKSKMISASRRWLRRNRTNFAIGAGILGVGYVAGQYVLSKISESRERVATERVAREK